MSDNLKLNIKEFEPIINRLDDCVSDINDLTYRYKAALDTFMSTSVVTDDVRRDIQECMEIISDAQKYTADIMLDLRGALSITAVQAQNTGATYSQQISTVAAGGVAATTTAAAAAAMAGGNYPPGWSDKGQHISIWDSHELNTEYDGFKSGAKEIARFYYLDGQAPAGAEEDPVHKGKYLAPIGAQFDEKTMDSRMAWDSRVSGNNKTLYYLKSHTSDKPLYVIDEKTGEYVWNTNLEIPKDSHAEEYVFYYENGKIAQMAILTNKNGVAGYQSMDGKSKVGNISSTTYVPSSSKSAVPASGATVTPATKTTGTSSTSGGSSSSGGNSGSGGSSTSSRATGSGNARDYINDNLNGNYGDVLVKAAKEGQSDKFLENLVAEMNKDLPDDKKKGPSSIASAKEIAAKQK